MVFYPGCNEDDELNFLIASFCRNGNVEYIFFFKGDWAIKTSERSGIVKYSLPIREILFYLVLIRDDVWRFYVYIYGSNYIAVYNGKSHIYVLFG